MKGNAAFVNEFSFSGSVLDMCEASSPDISLNTVSQVPGGLRQIGSLMTDEEMFYMVSELNERAWVPVGVDGVLSHYTPGDRIGSWRASCFEPRLADVIFNRLKTVLPSVWEFDGFTTENAPFSKWKFVGVNPLFRFIKYKQGGSLIPHFDRAFDQGDTRTLASLVTYFTHTSENNGRTRFIEDDFSNVLVVDKDLDDAEDFASTDSVYYAGNAVAGDAIVFDHCVLHDSEDHTGVKPKIIARSDLVFEPFFE